MKRPEQDLQRQVVRYVRLAYPQVLMWHVGNGGMRTAVEAARFKEMGVLAGVPDLHFVLPNGRLGMIELKAGRGKLSVAQADFRVTSEMWGCLWAMCCSLDEVASTLAEWYGVWGHHPRVRL